MSRPADRWHRRALAIAFVCGALAFILFLAAASDTPPAGALPDEETSAASVEEGTRGRSTILFEAIAFLGFEPPPDALHTSDDWRLIAARYLLAAFALLGVLGLVMEFFRPARDAARRIAFWFARTFRRREPAVLIGLGDIGGALARELREQRRPVYAIAPDDAGTRADDARRAGVLVVTGDATADLLRTRACIAHASEVFIATGDDIRNVEIAGDLLRDFARDQARRNTVADPLDCYVHTSDPGFAASFASHRLLHDSKGRIVFHGFNLQQQVARDLLLDPRDGIARRYRDGDVPYYIVFGFGSMGQTVALQMARLAHFSSFRRPRLTILDDFGSEASPERTDLGEAGPGLREFLDRYPGFSPDPRHFDMLAHRRLDLADKDGWGCRAWRPAASGWRSQHEHAVEYAANAEFLDMPSTVDAPGLIEQLLGRIEPVRESPADGRQHREPGLNPILVLCFDDERRNFEAALALRQAFESARFEGALSRPLPTYVYLRTEQGLATLLENAPEFRFSDAVKLHVFGLRARGELYRQVARLEVRRMARVVQESYNHYYGGSETFDELSPDFQASNIDAAAHADLKLDAIGYRRRPATSGEQLMPMSLSHDQIETLAHMEHNRWMAERLTSGWRIGERRQKKIGEIRLDNRRRPSFVPWERLAEEQQHEKGKDVSQVLALDTMYWRVGQVVESIERGESLAGDAELTLAPDTLRSVAEDAPIAADSPAGEAR